MIITDHIFTDWSYYFSVLIPNVLLPILTITICWTVLLRFVITECCTLVDIDLVVDEVVVVLVVVVVAVVVGKGCANK